MNDLTHKRRAIVGDRVEYLSFSHKSSGTEPLSVLGCQLAKEFVLLESLRNRMQRRRCRVNWRRRSAGFSPAMHLLLTHEKREENMISIM